MNAWVIICNLKAYDVIGAFKSLKRINWKQSTNIKVGDCVYVYVTKPIESIMFKTMVIKANLNEPTIDDEQFVINGSRYINHGRHIEIELIHKFDDDDLKYDLLRNHGLKTIQGPSRVTADLQAIINEKLLKAIRSNLSDQDICNREEILDHEMIIKIGKESTSIEKVQTEYLPAPKQVPAASIISGYKTYPRDISIANRALLRANYECETDSTHKTFLRKSTGSRYVEPHHLIPLAYQAMFNYSLDVEANIVALCSHCHNQIHYGQNADELIVKLYYLRQEELTKCGLSIAIDDLMELYN